MVNDNESNVIEGNFGMMYGLVDDTVNIPRAEYENLLEDGAWLSCLNMAGVDSWEGIETAQRIYDGLNEQK